MKWLSYDRWEFDRKWKTYLIRSTLVQIAFLREEISIEEYKKFLLDETLTYIPNFFKNDNNTKEDTDRTGNL